MSGTTLYIHSPDFIDFKMSDEHPFNPIRYELTTDLIKMMGLLSKNDIVEPSPAAIEQLTLVHDQQYINTVIQTDKTGMLRGNPLSCGLGTQDNPIFKNMHDAACLAVGATLKAAELVIENKASHTLNISGGLHHAQQNQASGFCIYNDITVTIAWLREKYDIRIMYIDTDAHHGDGVQWFFYGDPHVLTVSIHETGQYLFPGTGSIDELGVGKGSGYCINLPLEPFTNDTSYLECFEILLQVAAYKFKPDIIISQHGCDTHFLDPLSHLSLTTKSLASISNLIHNLAHEKAEGRWVALGGGGYNIWNVVPRAWTILWAQLSGREKNLQNPIPSIWKKKWQQCSNTPLSEYLWDNAAAIESKYFIEEIYEKNSIILERLLDNYGMRRVL